MSETVGEALGDFAQASIRNARVNRAISNANADAWAWKNHAEMLEENLKKQSAHRSALEACYKWILKDYRSRFDDVDKSIDERTRLYERVYNEFIAGGKLW
jgi:RNA binding exosome subunit